MQTGWSPYSIDPRRDAAGFPSHGHTYRGRAELFLCEYQSVVRIGNLPVYATGRKLRVTVLRRSHGVMGGGLLRQRKQKQTEHRTDGRGTAAVSLYQENTKRNQKRSGGHQDMTGMIHVFRMRHRLVSVHLFFRLRLKPRKNPPVTIAAVAIATRLTIT